MTREQSRFLFLKKNLHKMAEQVLEQVIALSDAFENGDKDLCPAIIKSDDSIDLLEMEIDNLSQTAILESVAVGNDFETPADLAWATLPFALSAIRITRNFERIGDQVVNCAKTFKRGRIKATAFTPSSHLTKISERVVTITGMAVESLIEEKRHFIGDINTLEDEIDRACDDYFDVLSVDDSISKLEFADNYRILLCLERIGDLALNVAEELYRLNTGKDIRHKKEKIPAYLEDNQTQ